MHITHWTHDPIYNRDILLMERHLMRMYIIITHGVTEPDHNRSHPKDGNEVFV